MHKGINNTPLSKDLKLGRQS